MSTTPGNSSTTFGAKKIAPTTNKKMNSFRAGPVRATMNAFDSSLAKGYQQENMAPKSTTLSNAHTIQRPASSKPFLEGSANSSES